MDEELQLGHYGRIFKRNWWMFALSVAAMVLFAVLLLPSQRDFFESRISFRLVPSDGDVGTFNDPVNEETEAIIAKSLGDEVIARVGGTYPELTLEGWDENLAVSACADTDALIVTSTCNTQILDFSYRASSPQKAIDLVEASAEIYREARFERASVIRENTLNQLDGQLADLDLRIQTEEAILQNNDDDSVEYLLAEIRLRRIEPERLELRSAILQLTGSPLDVGSQLSAASTPESDSSGIALPISIVAGVLMGLLLGGVAAVLSDRLDRRVSSASETETDLGVPVLGDIPRITEGNPALVTAVSAEAEGAEAFRRLAAAALAPRNGFVVDSIAVTGATDKEGRTTTAVNFALAIAQSGREVLLIGADRRNDAINQLFGLGLEPGLNDFLRSRADLDAARSALDAAPLRLGITVLPTGTGAPTPLSNNGIASLLAVAQERNMIAVFDTPPALTHADGLQIAAVADAVYVVAAVGRTRRSELNELRVQLINVQADVAGAIINRSSRLSLLPAGGNDSSMMAATAAQSFSVDDRWGSNSSNSAAGERAVEDAELVEEQSPADAEIIEEIA